MLSPAVISFSLASFIASPIKVATVFALKSSGGLFFNSIFSIIDSVYSLNFLFLNSSLLSLSLYWSYKKLSIASFLYISVSSGVNLSMSLLPICSLNTLLINVELEFVFDKS